MSHSTYIKSDQDCTQQFTVTTVGYDNHANTEGHLTSLGSSHISDLKVGTPVATLPGAWGRYHGGRRPPSDDSFHSPIVISPLALDKPSIMKCYYHRRTCSHTPPCRSTTMAMLHDTRFVECQWWNDGWTVKTVVTWRSSAAMTPAPGVIRTLLGLAGPLSVHCDWLEYRVWSATSISVWQHIHLSEQICPWNTQSYMLLWC